MSRRVPVLVLLVATSALVLSAQEAGSPSSSPGPSTVASPTIPTLLDTARPIADTVGQVVAPVPPDTLGVLVFPIADSLATDTSSLPMLFRDSMVALLRRDTLPHGSVDAWPGAKPDRRTEAESLAVGARTILWAHLIRDDSGHTVLRVEHILRVSDSALASFDVPTALLEDSAIWRMPAAVLYGLFPRVMPPPLPPPPPPVSLSDSVKNVAVLAFLPEGTAQLAHASSFTDTLARILQGRDGFQVMPAKLRDSLLSGWDPGECLTASCRQEVGERLGVPWIVTGHIGQLGDKWSVRAALVRVDSGVGVREAMVQCQGAPKPSLKLASGMTARQIAGQEKPRPEFSDAPVARESRGPAWARIVALCVATTLGVVGVLLSW